MICEECGEECTRVTSRQLYCSVVCKMVVQHRRREELRQASLVSLECPCCRETFRQRRLNQEWCSRQCKTKGNNRIRRGRNPDGSE